MRRTILKAMALSCVLPARAIAQLGPNPISMLITFSPGGPNDTVARLMCDKLDKATHTPFVALNKPGAGGTIALALAASSKPDGKTIVFATGANLTIAPYFYKSLPYNAQKDLTPIVLIASAPMVLAVRKELEIDSIKQLVERLKSEPGKMAYGTPGNGTTGQLFIELFLQVTGTQMLNVPFKGSSPMMLAMLGNEIDVVSDGISALAPHVKSGKLKLLGVASSSRLESFPEVPTLDEQGVRGADASFWNALLAPSGTPAKFVQELNHQVNELLKTAELRERLGVLGLTAIGGPPEKLKEAIVADYRKWGRAISAAHIETY